MVFFRNMSSPREGEREPLLQSPAIGQTEEQPEANYVQDSPLNKFSTTDLYWILAGTWSGVFLGALDGRSHSLYRIQNFQPGISCKERWWQLFWYLSAALSISSISHRISVHHIFCRSAASRHCMVCASLRSWITLTHSESRSFIRHPRPERCITPRSDTLRCVFKQTTPTTC